MRDRLNINLSAGRSCFVRCHGCYNHFGSSPDPLTTDLIVEFLAAARMMGADRVTLCGGDPLSRPDIIEVIWRIRTIGYKVTLDTVGTPLLGATQAIFYGRHGVAPINASTLASIIDEIGIPVDGFSETTIQSFRKGRTNFLSEQLSILSLLNENEANICVNTVVNKNNIDGLDKIFDLLHPFKSIHKWQLFQFMPSGPLGFRNRTEYEVSDSAFSGAVNRLMSHSKKKKSDLLIEPKSITSRKGNYLLIDSDGIAWMPKSSADNTCSADRNIIGDIKKTEDFDKIFLAMLDPAKAVQADKNS